MNPLSPETNYKLACQSLPCSETNAWPHIEVRFVTYAKQFTMSGSPGMIITLTIDWGPATWTLIKIIDTRMKSSYASFLRLQRASSSRKKHYLSALADLNSISPLKLPSSPMRWGLVRKRGNVSRKFLTCFCDRRIPKLFTLPYPVVLWKWGKRQLRSITHELW